MNKEHQIKKIYDISFKEEVSYICESCTKFKKKIVSINTHNYIIMICEDCFIKMLNKQIVSCKFGHKQYEDVTF